MFKSQRLALVALAACLFVFLLGPAVALAGDAPIPTPDANAIVAALAEQKWTMLAALLIGLVVRLLKEDVKFLPTIPSRWRPLVALGLGLVSSFLLVLQPGVSWQKALAEGVVAGFFAMGGHGIVIEALRGGREIGVAKIDQDAPTRPKLPPDPPSGAGGALMAFAFVLSFALHGCGGVKAPTARDATRAGVELLATALPMANELCSKSTDRAVLETCAKAYDVGRPSLVAAAQLVDVWAGASENDKACALSASLKAVAAIVDAMRAGGLEVPDLIRDAVSFAAPLLGSCKSVTP